MVTDRDSTIDGEQITDRTIKQLELDLTDTPTDGQIIKVNMPTGDMTPIDIGNVSDIATMQTNIVLNAFRIAINGSLTQFNMLDGIVDEYEDESSIDTLNSTSQLYDSILDLYSPSGGIPIEAYTSDSFTKLLLHMDGSDASTTFTDDGDTGHTVTAIGNAQIDTAESVFGGASGLFDGTGDYLTVPDSDDWNFADGDFTIDLRVRFNSVAGQFGHLASQFVDNNDQWKFLADGTDLIFQVRSGGVAIINIIRAWIPVVDTWYYVVLVRTGDDFKFFIDGVQLGTTATDSSTFPDYSAVLQVGKSQDGELNGWIDEFRISKGVARFTTDFDIADDMTLISDTFTAEAQPDNARIVLFEEDIDSVTLNTDLKAFISRDAGQTFTTDFATDNKLDITSHGFSNTDRIMVTSSAQDLPAGLDPATVYFVINATTNDFELSLTSGGSAVAITDNGTGTHTAKQVTEVTLANDGEYETGKNILTGSSDISGQTAGTSMEYYIQTLNNKNLNIHGTGLSWD